MIKNSIMKNLLKNIIVLAILISLILYCNKVLATTTMTISAKFNDSTIAAGNETIINIAIDKLESSEQGINAYVFSLDFNTDDFEFVKAEAQNGWNSPAYNEINIKAGKTKFAATRSTFTKETGNIVKLILKAKKSFSSSNAPTVRISDISFAAKEGSNTQKIVLNDINITMDDTTTKSNKNDERTNNEEQVTSEKTINNNGAGTITSATKGTATSKNANLSSSNNKSTVMLPNAGIETQIWIAVLSLLVINIIIIYSRYKKIYKYI